MSVFLFIIFIENIFIVGVHHSGGFGCLHSKITYVNVSAVLAMTVRLCWMNRNIYIVVTTVFMFQLFV